MNRQLRKAVLMSLVIPAALLAGCSSSPRDSSTFAPGGAGQVQSVEWGTIEALRPVTIEASRTLARSTAGVEFTVRLESGRPIVVVQPGSASDYRVGDRVRVTNDGTTTRVAR
ncbi:outer membrane lipoprotein [Pseudoxanthomonas sp. 10H]|uniref:outer membrane lipoprotein n=1 Tax=Pseudoxanthomonas sp. 10H TaxID=3242729 RepID=UPI00355610E0